MNPSILGIVISSGCVFLTGLVFFVCKGKNYFFLTLLAILTTVVITLTFFSLKGRAGFIGGFSGFLYLLYSAKKKSPQKQAVIIAFITLCCLFILLFFTKKESSSGRVLIYKVVFSQLKPKDYFTGIGLGKFKSEYNKMQASYFEAKGINNGEALLAGNGYYLFNDWLQISLEIGIAGILAVISIFLFFKKFFFWRPRNKPILVAANSYLISTGVAAFFSYPLQVPATLSFFIICLVMHLHNGWRVKDKYRHLKIKYVFYGLSVSFALTVIIYFLAAYILQKNAEIAYNLARDGFKKEAEVLYSALTNYPVKDYNVFYNYAYLLYFKNDLNNALHHINKSLELAYSNNSVKLKADILYELHNEAEAETFYKQAVYITPGRMLPKYDLFQFYLKTDQFEKAEYWGEDILKMRIKIPSEMTVKIQASVKELLIKYKL